MCPVRSVTYVSGRSRDKMEPPGSIFHIWVCITPQGSAGVRLRAMEHLPHDNFCQWAQAWLWKWVDDPIAVFTTMLVAVTLGLAIYTWKLWRATGALAAGAEDTARRQLRAYISVDYEQVRDINGNPKPNVIGLAIKNCGQTPAHAVSHWTMSGVVDFPLRPGGVLPPPGIPDPAKVKTVLHPTMHRTVLLPFSLSDESKEQIRSGKFAFYVWGEVNYLDAFDHPRKTRFCFFLNKEALAQNRMAYYESGNEAT